MPESTAAEDRGVSNRGLPPRDRTIDARQAAQREAARLQALAPSTYRRSDASPPERQDFQAFSRQYEQLANERHVWRFARPDGSTYETSWRGLGTGTTAQAHASVFGHRVIGEVIPGPVVEGPREPRLTPPPLVQAEPPYSSPPLVQANRIDDNERGIANETRALTRSAKKSSPQKRGGEGANLRSGTWSARLLEVPSEIFAADPKDAGDFANPDIPRPLRELALGIRAPYFGLRLQLILVPIVSNFLINLGLENNDRSELIAAGIIFPGQSKDDENTVLGNGSQLNAFRHTFGQALITKEFGRKLAEVVGFAHEDRPTIDTTRRYFSNPAIPSNALFEADTVADQLNNEIGRRIAESLGPKASNRDLAEAVLRAFREEGLYVASFLGPGQVMISRQRLTQQQYNKYMLLLKSLNEEGLHRSP